MNKILIFGMALLMLTTLALADTNSITGNMVFGWGTNHGKIYPPAGPPLFTPNTHPINSALSAPQCSAFKGKQNCLNNRCAWIGNTRCGSRVKNPNS